MDKIKVFTLNPRISDKNEALLRIRNNFGFTKKYGFTGVLLYNGNNVFFEPFILAQELLSTHGLSPLIAVNPVYQSPFSVARSIASLTFLYNKKISINFISGVSLSDFSELNDTLDHDQRYDRLQEFIEVLSEFFSESEIINYDGNFYKIKDFVNKFGIKNHLKPDFYISGGSEKAVEVAGNLNLTLIKPGQPVVEMGNSNRVKTSPAFGVICRNTDREAVDAAETIFRDNQYRKRILPAVMKNTDSQWKKELYEIAEGAQHPSYNLTGFTNLSADIPYIVGGIDKVKEYFVNYMNSGADTFLINLPPDEENYHYLNETVKDL